MEWVLDDRAEGKGYRPVFGERVRSDNVLFGGGGADTFEFTLSSNGDIVEDFSLYQGDRLIFFNSGGIVFDLASVTWEAGTMTIGYTETVSFRTGQVEIELNSAETLEENDILAVIEIL